ncbi:hypothetical protein [Actinomadura rudentiformis]|uniref:Uncharacterized protein n=1 Tax=Actinomadura rudentiformis TaxID=359158 RepID=A0A6H9YI67_9ACTN|nr:hypothetical protein [Actinomadura rudentiformis]KAB2340601.1 hypothetical protein F8566_44575 [Actinomadura rudentiformis]
MNDTLDHTLRDLDPAVTPADLDTSTDPKARALLARVVATDSMGTPEPTTSSPRKRTARRLTAIGGGVAVGIAAALLLPGVFGGGSAMAAWTATPHTVSGDRAADAQKKCLDSARDTAKNTTGRELGFRPVVTEGRGPWTLVYVNDDSSHLAEITCLLDKGDLVGSTGSTPGPDAQPLPPVPAGSARAALGSVMSTSEESVRVVTGRVGAGVVGLELATEAKGSVAATVSGGYFAAWWPDAPTTEERENASPRGGVKHVTAILQNGSRHNVSLEELTGRTSAQLNTPATGGSTRG